MEIARYPVFGLVETQTFATYEYDVFGNITAENYYTEDRGFVAFVEEGASLMQLTSSHGGPTSEYNTIKISVKPRPTDSFNLQDSVSVAEDRPYTVVSDRKYTGSYKIRYMMLTDENLAEQNGVEDYYECSYMGMAKAYREYLEAQGYDVLVFHATGTGGQCMESLIDGGFIKGVLDITTTEWCDEVVGGVLSAGPNRLAAAGKAGIPQVVSVGALDMVNFGPWETVPAQFKERNLYKHNPTVTLMRTTGEELAVIGQSDLLTLKKTIYVSNLAENEINEPETNRHYMAVKALAAEEGSQLIPICAKLEADIAELDDPEEKAMFMEELGVAESGLDRLIKSSYALLGLISFLTAGSDECRAWTIKRGTKAPQAAGKIHTDFERGFIRAEVIKYEDYIRLGSEAAVREAGLLKVEGKEYVVQDGDIMHFRFNV